MALKFVFVIALCVAQGFAFKPLNKFPENKPCKHPASEYAEEIPQEFEEALHEMDEIRETVSMAAIDAYFKGNDADVIIACFRQQRGNYYKLGQQISGMIRKSAQEMAQELGNEYEKYAKRMEVPIRKIGMTMKMLPEKMWMYIRNKEFDKALEVMRESRRIVDENSKELAKIIAEIGEEMPEVAEKAEGMAREIRETARKGCKAIGEAFKKCVEEGGPKTPIVDAEIGTEEEEAPEE